MGEGILLNIQSSGFHSQHQNWAHPAVIMGAGTKDRESTFKVPTGVLATDDWLLFSLSVPEIDL